MVVFRNLMVALLAAFFALGCSKPDKGVSDNPTTRGHAALTKRFAGPQGRYLGADGVYTARFGGDVVVVFSDTLVGELERDRLKDNARFLNNSAARITDSGLEFLSPFFENRAFIEPTQPGEWYWFGHPWVSASGARMHLFMYRLERRGQPGTFDFRLVSCDVATFDESLEDVPTIRALPYCDPGSAERPDTSWGAWSLAMGEDIWIFGVRNAQPKELVLARVDAKSFERNPVEGWEFWSKDGWSPNASEARSILTRVSNELGVIRVGERFAMIYQLDGMSDDVVVSYADALTGPWSAPETLWVARETDGDHFAYNAKPHPALTTEPGKIVVSYNVNTLDFFGDYRHLHAIYHPRFFVWNPR